MNKEEWLLLVRSIYKQTEELYNETPEQDKVELSKLFKKEIDRVAYNISNLDSPNLILRFGKFKGQKIKDVPAWYLLWCYEQDWFKEHNKDLYDYIKGKVKSLKSMAEKERKEKKETVEPDLHEDWGDRDPV